MNFSNYPISASTPITYDLLIVLWQGWWRRKIAMGQIYWPPPDESFPGETDSGKITGTSFDSTENRITATCQFGSSWDVGTGQYDCGAKRWVNHVCTQCELSIMPANYDLIVMVDFYEPRTHIRMPIIDQTIPGEGDTTANLIVDATPAINAVTAKYISSLGDLNGKEYYIQKRGGAWITDRWPTRPDDQQQWKGTGNGGTAYWQEDETTTYVTLQDSDEKTAWSEDEWIDKEVVVYNGSFLKRLQILHNDSNTLYVAQSSESTGIGGAYSIIDAGLICNPTTKPWHYQQWIYANADVSVGHTADDGLATVVVPGRNYQYPSGSPCGNGNCGEFPRNEYLFDNQGNQRDFKVDTDDICAGSRAGNYVQRDIWKSLRMLQQDIEASCINFLTLESDEGKTNILTYYPATLFRDIGCPSGTSSTQFQSVNTSEDGTETGFMYITVGGEFIGQRIRYLVLDKKGKPYSWGITSSDENGVVANIIEIYGGVKNPDVIGFQVIYSLPWVGAAPDWVRYLYPKTMFLPDVGSGVIGGTPTAQDPPRTYVNEDGTIDCFGVGKWITRPKSEAGFVSSTGYVVDGLALKVGGIYRYIGDSYYDPFPGGPVDGYGAILNPYENKFYRGKLSRENENARNDSKTGIVKSGNFFSLTTDQTWWHDWASHGVLRVESGTSSSGSDSTLVDNTKNTTIETQSHKCYWKVGGGDLRYLTKTDGTAETAYENFILEVDKVRTLPADRETLLLNPQATVQETVTFKVPINSTEAGTVVKVNFTPFQIPKYNSSNQTWTWETFVVGTDPYRIKEPAYELNKWRDRTVTVTADGVKVLDKEPILFSDNETLFFATKSVAIPAGSKFEIHEKQFGVYKWTGTEFIPATGADSERLTVSSPVDFLENINYNNNSWHKKYGLIEYGDCANYQILNQLYKAMDLLRDTKGPLSWTNKSSDTAEPEKNARQTGSQLPYWTESAAYYAALMQYADEAGIPRDNVAYNSHANAWKRCWRAIFDLYDPFHQLSEAEYEDRENGGDGTIKLDGTAPQQCGQFEDVYDYKNKYDGYYLCCGCNVNYPNDVCSGCIQGCGFGNSSDGGNVLFAHLYMKAVESYGLVSPQRGFLKLSANVSGLIHAVIGPGDPEPGYYFPYGDHTGTDHCTSYRISSIKNKFETAGSGAIWRKWHVYSTFSVPKGTKKNIYGPKYGSKDFLGEPDVNKLPCVEMTCTTYDYSLGRDVVYYPCQEHDDYGYMGWLVDEQFTRISWNMEGY